MSHLIEIRDTTRIYKQGKVEVRALRGVTLDIERGEFTVLAGASGSGKTTLLNQIGCLDRPTTGSVSVDGKRINELGRGAAADFRLHRIGFVFQSYNLIPVLSAYENAEFVMLLQGIDKDKRRQVVEPLLERVGLADMASRKPHELSGGQQQRIAVVRALAAGPSIVLADEPTANLDTETSKGLLDLMLELNQESSTTFLFSSHDDVVIERARRVIRLDSGRVVSDVRN